MAAFGDPVTERFLCSICLDVFIDPVSTPCGHNFCQTCLKSYWDTNQYFICPNCNERFSQRPDLKINTTLRDLVLHNKSELLEMMEGKQKAAAEQYKDVIKHLKKEISELKKINFDLELIAERQRSAEGRCENVIKGLKREITEMKKRNIELEMTAERQKTAEKRYDEELEMMKEKQKAADEQYKDVIKDLKKELTELMRKNIEQEMIVVNQKAAEKRYENLIKGLEQEISELKGRNTELEMMKEKQKAADEQYKDVIKDLTRKNIEQEMIVVNQKAAEKQYKKLIKYLEQEITELKSRNTEQQMIVVNQRETEKQSENLMNGLAQENANLIRRNTELEMIVVNQRAAEKQSEDVIKYLKRRNTELQMKISNTANNLRLLQEIHQQELRQQQKSLWWIIVVIAGSILFAGFVVDHNIRQHNEAAEWKCMKQSAVDVTLDPDTAHPNLILSDDQKQVKTGDTALSLPNYSKRFNNYFNVLGKEGFSSGRFYYEVQVKRKICWVLGVARESSNRKGEITLAPMNGYWTVSLNGNEYLARAGPDVSLSLSVNPQKVGVFVDYNEGLVSFYDVDSRSHIYSFTGQTFTKKLYPVFSTCDNKDPLIITPVNYNE